MGRKVATHEVDFRRLFVLSYIKVAHERYVPQNTFEAFFPFVIAAADPKDGNEYNPSIIAAALRSSLGWPVGSDFVQLFTTDFERRGYVTPPDASNIRKWTVSAEKPDDDGSQEEIEHLQRSFFDFSERLSALFLHNLSSSDRLHALANALVTNRLFSIDALQDYASRGSIESNYDSPEGSNLTGKDFEYLCARFIKHCHDNDTRSFKALIVLSNIGIVTQLANFFHRRDDDIEKTGNPDLILDGPFLIDLIGLNGDTRRADAEIIVNSAKQRGCKIAAFRHSVNEAVDIVRAVKVNDPSTRYGPLAAAIRRGDISLEALDAFVTDPFGLVDRLKILDYMVDVNSKKNKWQEEDFSEEDWKAVYAKLAGWKDNARRRDCDSMMGVMRMRAGGISRSPWRAKYFLLTSNDALARYAKQACMDQGLIDQYEMGPAISRNEFAAILWLAGDKKNRLEIVTAHLLGAAQGLLARDRQLIERVKDYSENLSGERKHLLNAIVETELSYEYLQDITLGNPDRVNDENVEKIIQALVDKGRQEGDAAAREEEKRSTARLRAMASQAEVEKTQALERAATAETQASAALTTAEQAERDLLQARSLVAAAEARRLASEAEAKRLLDAATLARKMVQGVLDGAEADWSRKWQASKRVATSIGWLAAALLAGSIVFAGWILRGFTGAIPALALSIVIGWATASNDWFKAGRAKLEASLAELLSRETLAGERKKLQRRLSFTGFSVETEFHETGVRIRNRDQILSAVELVAPAPVEEQ